MSLVENKFTKSKNARYWAVALYSLGVISLVVGYILPQSWSIWFMEAAFVFWAFPVTWCAYKWSIS